MAFQGVLLQLLESKNEANLFHVVAPTAELILSQHSMSRYATCLTTSSHHQFVIVDAVSRKLLQVTQLARMTLLKQEKSVLWGTTASFGSSDACTVDNGPMKSGIDVLKASAVQTNEFQEVTENVEFLSTRICYCFHFRSDFEYEMFAQTLEAFTRMQQYMLLHSSVKMEMEISHEYKKKKAKEDVRLQNAANETQKRRKLLPTTKKEEKEKKREEKEKKKKEKQQVVPTQMKAKVEAKGVLVTPPSKMLCVLCRIQKKPDAPEYPKHPFVLKDGKGEMVHICKVCLQRVLKQHVAMQASAKKGARDNICGLCAQSMEKVSEKSVKVCAHEVCPRVYCIPCIDKLIGKARAHKVWRTKNWLCPNCSTDDDSVPAGCPEKENGAGYVSVEIVAAGPAPKQKKRKRHKEMEENSTADEDGLSKALISVSSASEMKLIDYAATYFKFLLKRERKDEFEESEDVCFCCKDGGDLIECDWNGTKGTFKRCPKVYHEDCLGYKVPEGKTWVCPRHRCQDCGIIAQYSCRFCVTSYCKGHLPKDVKKLGRATKDIPTSTYVMCPRCDQQAKDAAKQKKIGPDFHSKLFRRRAGKR
ncbi:unnamed protein product [Peronospora farinosa]|uniref:RING-type domain-containing protein n=1 Tax=Peronospora farinosa TaxID=134698 RepID=A0AAV0SPD5_9STRA|nr:unnamed protein product [Peronospora farinosa]CAI5705083.1 unnamed protein product [Peronospora farinosa]